LLILGCAPIAHAVEFPALLAQPVACRQQEHEGRPLSITQCNSCELMYSYIYIAQWGSVDAKRSDPCRLEAGAAFHAASQVGVGGGSGAREGEPQGHGSNWSSRLSPPCPRPRPGAFRPKRGFNEAGARGVPSFIKVEGDRRQRRLRFALRRVWRRRPSHGQFTSFQT
jgi:hypothetical protein